MAPVRPEGRYSLVDSDPKVRQAAEDRATIRAIKGKGIVLTFSSHFIVAVVAGVTAAVMGHRSAPLPEAQEQAVRHLTEDVAALRTDLIQLKAEVAQRDRDTEWKLNELLTRK
jgi:hypothetical protein